MPRSSPQEWWSIKPPVSPVVGSGLKPNSPAILVQLESPAEEQAFVHALTSYHWAVVVCRPLTDLPLLARRWDATIALVGEIGVMQIQSSGMGIPIISIADDERSALDVLNLGADFVMIRPILAPDPLITPGVFASA